MDQIQDEVVYYYDTHPTEEDLMGETLPHAELIDYLKNVLEWLFRTQICAIYKNFNFFQSSDEDEHPLAPDLAVIKGVSRVAWRSWRVGIHGPAPHVVFEIASDKTWERDLAEKPEAYAAMGVQEYYAYDPYEPALPLSRRHGQRLSERSEEAERGQIDQGWPEILRSTQNDMREGLFHGMISSRKIGKEAGIFYQPLSLSFHAVH